MGSFLFLRFNPGRLLPDSFAPLFPALFLGVFSVFPVYSQSQDRAETARVLKKLSLEELMDVEVFSVSRSREKLTEVASAIQVLTHEDIRRSGATRLPEALRLASNLIVARSNSHDWAVTARGFNGAPFANNTSANKLLVMIDGRTVYSPLFGGVFWDVQNVLLEDVDRIEIISGPGGTLWGANAVNGVINIITKRADDSQGLYATVAAGTFLRDHAALRYGFRANDNLFVRVYGQRYDQEGTEALEGFDDEPDAWNMTQGGFRMDYYGGAKTELTVQGDFYNGRETDDDGDIVDGQNLLARWSRAGGEGSEFRVQLYYDRTWRYLPSADFGEELHTYDADIQHHFGVGARHDLLWGAGYRFMKDIINNSPQLSFSPRIKDMNLVSVFLQDRILLVPERMQLTVGSKFVHNVYSGWDLQPSARAAWTPDPRNTVWAAVSRTVRTPTRWDTDEISPHIITPAHQFSSEKVLTYELGYRLEPMEKISVSVATFYNLYDDVKSINTNPAPPPGLIFANDQEAESMGYEVSGNYYAGSHWRIRGGYTFLKTRFTATHPSVVAFSSEFEAIDPKSQFVFQSILDLPGNLNFDVTGRYLHRLERTAFTPRVPSYFTMDARIGWEAGKVYFAVIGQNLTEKNHLEFGSRKIARSFLARVTCRL